MIRYKTLIIIGIAVTSFGVAQSQVQGQGRSGRARETSRPGGSVVPADRAVERQVQRRAGDEARRAFDRRVAGAEAAARAVARRIARDAGTSEDLRRFAQEHGLRPEWVAQQANKHADIHASIAAGILTERPLHLDESQREKLEEVFGDADLIEPRRAPTDNQSRQTNRNENAKATKNRTTEAVQPEPGSRANVRARLANAIRVRRAQISELRDRAIETGDDKLLERADQFETTLDTFLQNQARVDANLAQAGQRARLDPESDSVEPEVSDPTIRTAELQADDGLID